MRDTPTSWRNGKQKTNAKTDLYPGNDFNLPAMETMHTDYRWDIQSAQDYG